MSSVLVTRAPHPLLDAGVFVTRFSAPLGELSSPPALLTRLGQVPPPRPEVELAVRALLRHGGFKPSGRSKPASEYLVRAATEGNLGSINLAVDVCNVISLARGLPISVIDLDRAVGPLAVGIPEGPHRYVFNTTGQEIDVTGLLSVLDADGPCAGPVKDAQRTKTHPGTTRTLSVVWGTRGAPGLTAQVVQEYRACLAELGAETEEV